MLDFWVQVVPCLLVERSSSERASRIPSGSVEVASFFALGRQVRSKLAPRSHFFAFFSQDASKLRFLAFSDGFSLDFGRFGEGFGNVLARFSHDFPQNAILEKIAFSLEKTDKIKGWRHERHWKNRKQNR